MAKSLATRRLQALSFLVVAMLLGATCGVDDTVTPDEEPVAGTANLFELFVAALPDDAFNIVFVPDDGYGDMAVLANRQAFVSDLATLIENGFWQNQAYFNGLFHFNYYYMTVSGDITVNRVWQIFCVFGRDGVHRMWSAVRSP